MTKMLTDFLMYGRYISYEEVMSHVKGFGSKEASQFLEEMLTSGGEPFSLILYGDFEKNKASGRVLQLSKQQLIK